MVEKPIIESKLAINPDHLVTIGELTTTVTNMTGKRCTSAMVYNYERIGLIPTPDRTSGGFRLFKPYDVILVAQIKRWQEQGLTLGEIKEKLQQNGDNFDEDLIVNDLVSDRKTQILVAAGSVFIQKGYKETTLQDIAQVVGITSAAIYQYFNSKEELFLSLVDNLSFIDVMDEITSPLELSSRTKFEDIRATLIEVAEAFLDRHHPNADVMRLFVAEVRHFPEIGERYCQRLIAPIEARLEQYFQTQIDRGLFRTVDVKLAVHAFFGIFLNFVFTQDLLNGKKVLIFPSDNQVPQLVDLFLAGVKISDSW